MRLRKRREIGDRKWECTSKRLSSLDLRLRFKGSRGSQPSIDPRAWDENTHLNTPFSGMIPLAERPSYHIRMWICAVEGWDNLTEGTGVAISQAYGRHVPCYPGSFYLGSNKNRRFSTVCNHLRGSRWCSKFWSIKSSELKGRFLLVLKLCCSCQFAVVLK